MYRGRGAGERGSALLEFILFVILGQMFVFAGTLSAASLLSAKVELQTVASNAVKSIALGREPSIPPDALLNRSTCNAPLICVTVTQSSMTISAVGYQ